MKKIMAITTGTIADKLVKINDCKVDIADAIEEKGGTVPTKFSEYGDAVRALPTGGKFPCEIEELPVEDSDATFALFFNLDGQVVYCLSKDEVQALEELPTVPDESESGLINGSWNWTLAQLKAASHPVSVGPQYDTEDGYTWIKIETREANQEFKFNLPSQQSVRNLMSVDWGDGTVEQAPPALPTHTYATAGKYTIKISMTSSDWAVQLLGWRNTWIDYEIRECVKEFYIGYYCNYTQQGLLTGCPNLTRISVPTTHPSRTTFYGPYPNNSLIKQITVPTGCTNYTIGGTVNNLNYTTNIRVICLPGTITGNANPNVNSGVYGLRLWRNQARGNLTFQQGAKLLVFECADVATTPVFNWTTNLRKLIFPKNPSSVITTIPNNFARACVELDEIENFPWNTITTIGQAFYQATNLRFPNPLNLPALTSITAGIAFDECQNLVEIYLGTAGNTLTIGGNQIFQGSINLRKVVFLATPDTIPAQTFNNCYGLEIVDFSTATSVPSLANVNAFSNTPNKKIIVPDALYSSWITATNWSSTTNNIVGSIVKASEA